MAVKICVIADGRSPITRSWLAGLVPFGHELHLISSYPVSGVDLPLASLHVIPLAFSGLLSPKENESPQAESGPRSLAGSAVERIRRGRFAHTITGLRFWLGPVEIRRHIERARRYLTALQPDIVHAMRIPFEGMFAALAVERVPLLVSVWGNDFTLVAEHYPPARRLTQWTLRCVDGLHCDCERDLRLAHRWGFAAGKPAVVLPGIGGLDLSVFRSGPGPRPKALRDLPPHSRIVINPRGIRSYVRNDVFFRAIPLIRQVHHDAVFICPGMEDEPQPNRWLRALAKPEAVRLLPKVPRPQLADYFRAAEVVVSPSVHDGTPNSLLEAMACGCFPVAGDLESVREWISDGVNGLLCDPTDPGAVAHAIIRALDDLPLRRAAAAYNSRLIVERAERGRVMGRADQFYEEVARAWRVR